MRLFIALDIPERSRQLLKNKVRTIKSNVDQDPRWVKSENWHLTLKFLGEVNQELIAGIKDNIYGIAENHNRFPIIFRGIGGFPALNYPKVLFIDIYKGANNLCEIHNEIDENLATLGFEKEEREYTPHLTIARCKNQNKIHKLAHSLKQFQDKYFINIYMKARQIKLMESKLKPDGPEYIEKFAISLK